MKRVFLTGANGFVGRHCVSCLLEDGFEVVAVGRSAAPPAPGVIPAAVDLLRAEQVAAALRRFRPTHLLHLAWVTAHGRYWTSPDNLAWVRSGLALLEEFARVGGRAVFAGTCAEYEWESGVCHETRTACRPASPYGAAKNALRLMVETFAGPLGVSAAWARLFFPYGPHEQPGRLVPSVVRSLLAGEPAACTHGAQRRDFIHAQDVAAALTALLNSNLTGPVNVGTGTAPAVREVVGQIARLVGQEDLVRLGALPSRPGEPDLVVADMGRLRDELGWSPRLDLATGLAQTVNWWRVRQAA